MPIAFTRVGRCCLRASPPLTSAPFRHRSALPPFPQIVPPAEADRAETRKEQVEQVLASEAVVR